LRTIKDNFVSPPFGNAPCRSGHLGDVLPADREIDLDAGVDLPSGLLVRHLHDAGPRILQATAAGASPTNIGSFATSDRSTAAIDILVPIRRAQYRRPKQASTACCVLKPGFRPEVALAQYPQGEEGISDAREARQTQGAGFQETKT